MVLLGPRQLSINLLHTRAAGSALACSWTTVRWAAAHMKPAGAAQHKERSACKGIGSMQGTCSEPPGILAPKQSSSHVSADGLTLLNMSLPAAADDASSLGSWEHLHRKHVFGH